MSLFNKLFNINTQPQKQTSEPSKSIKKHTVSVLPVTEEELLAKKIYLESIIENMEKSLIDSDKITQKDTRDVLDQLERDLDEIKSRLQKLSPSRPKHNSVTMDLPSRKLTHAISEPEPPQSEENNLLTISSQHSQAPTASTNDSDGEDAEEDLDEHPKISDFNGLKICSLNPEKVTKMGPKAMQCVIDKIVGSNNQVKVQQSSDGVKLEFAETRPRFKTKQFQRSQSSVQDYNENNTHSEPEPEAEIFKPNGLFEDFFLIGVDREEIQKNPAEVDENESRFKTLYQFQKNSSLNVYSYGSYLFPEGIEINSKLKSENAKTELVTKLINKARDKTKTPIIVLPFEPPPELLTAPWNPYTEKLNGHRRLYLISILCKDFIATKEGEGEEEMIVYNSVKFAMGFLTYYPITPFFIYFLGQIFDAYRNARKLLLLNKNLSPFDYDLIGSSKNFDEVFTPILKKFWKNFKSFKFGIKHQIYLDEPNFQFRLLFDMPISDYAPYLEGFWGAYFVFSHFSFSDIILILSAFMLDKKIVLFCEDLTKLTSFETALFALMKPFAYPYKPTFSLPKYLIPILGVNISTIIGLTQSEKFFWEEDLFNQFPDCIFIFMDDMKIYAANKETGIKKLPLLPFANDKDMQKAYNEMNNSIERMPIYTKSKVKDAHNIKFKHSRTAPLENSPEFYQEKILEIFKAFRKGVFENLVKPLLKFDWICSSQEEQEKFLVDYGRRSNFHKVFVQTQTLRLFVETLEDRLKNTVSLFTEEGDN